MRFSRNLCVGATCVLVLSWSVAAAAQPRPSARLEVPTDALVGDSVDEARVHFSNTAPGVNPGFGPFIDLVLDTQGIDGGSSPDGLVFHGALLLGQPLVTTTIKFPDEGVGTGCVDHPIARDTTLAPKRVCGPTGWSLVVMELPFASFVVGQPEVTIELDLEVSELADTSSPLELYARAGFRFGATPLDDPCCDPSLLEPAATDATSWPVAHITPTVMKVRTRYLEAEDERAVGPNFPLTYAVEVDIARGQVVDDLTFDVTLPSHLAYLGVTSTNVTPLVEPPLGRAPGGSEALLRVRLPTVVGGQGPDATWTFDAFVDTESATFSDTLTPATGDDRIEPLQVEAQGQWTPADPRDPSAPGNVSASSPSPEHELSEEAISVQHSWEIISDQGAEGVTPGDVIEHTCDIQISDVFAFTNLALHATISDGHRLITTDAPTLDYRHAGLAHTGAISVPHTIITPRYSPASPNPDGTTALKIELSSETAARGAGGDWLGGCVSSSPGAFVASCATQNSGPTTARVTWRTVVLDAFSDDFPSGDASVDAGDLLRVDVEVVGDLLDTLSLSPTSFDERDDSGSEIEVAPGEFDLQIVAINGQSPTSPIEVLPGDAVTYELTHELPSSDVEGLSFEIYFPLPVFDVTEVSNIVQLVPNATPGAGEITLGTSDTLSATLGVAPIAQIDPASNALKLSYPDFDDVANRQTTSALRVTVTATDEPFADALVLSALARSTHSSTNASGFERDRARAITLRQPVLRITKGVIETTPPTPGLDFDPTRPVTSSGLMAVPNDGAAGPVDAGDKIRFSVVIENVGGAQAWDVLLRDVRSPGLVTPPEGLNLEIRRGDGTLLTATPRGPGFDDEDLFGAGLLLDDPGGGVCQRYSPTAGTNIVTLSYDLMVADIGAIPAALLANQAELLSYHNSPNAPATNHVSDPRDHATSVISTIAEPTLEHLLVSSSEGYTANSDLTIGESFVGRVRVDVPESTMPGASVALVMPTTMELLAVDRVTRSSKLSVSAPGGWAGVEATSPTASGWGASLGTLTNSDREDASREVIEIEYTARVLDVPAAAGGQTAAPEAAITWSQGQTTAALDLDLIEPTLIVTKSATPQRPDEGDVVTYTLAIEHAASSTAPARRVTLVDDIPAGLALVPGSLRSIDGPAPESIGAIGARVDASWSALDLGQRAVIEYRVTMPENTQAATNFVEQANLTWESLDAGDSSREGAALDDHTLVSRAPTMTRRVLSTSLGDTADAAFVAADHDLSPGEEATIELEVTLPEGVTPQALIEFEAPNDATNGFTEVLAARIVSSGANLSASQTIQAILEDRDLDGRSDRVLVDLGDVLNLPDNRRDAADRVVLEIDVRALAVNLEGTSLRHRAWTRWTNGQLQRTTRFDVVRPRIQISKIMSGPAGDLASVTLRATNTGSGPAYGLVLEDLFDASSWDLSAVATIAVTPGIKVDLPDAGGSTPLTLTQIDPATPLAPGAQVEATFELPITSTARITGAIDNTLAASGVMSLPQTSPHAAFEAPITTTSTLLIGRPSLDKRAEVAVNLDGVGEVAPGDTLRYVLEVPNDGPGPLTELVIEDPTIEGFSLDPTTIQTSPGGIIEPWATGVRVRFANVTGWSTSWVSFEGVVEATPDERLSNQASMRWQEHEGPVLSDDPDTLAARDPVVLEVPLADLPTLAAPDELRGDEDTVMPLPLSAQLVDTDGSEVLEVHIEGIPEGATLSAGSIEGSRVVLTSEQLSGLSYSPPTHASGESTLRIVARAIEQHNMHVTEREVFTRVILEPVVDPPLLEVTPLAAREQIPSPVPLVAQLVDTDGSESLEVIITGAPEGTVFSVGAPTLEGWAVPGESLAGLTMTPPIGGGFTLSVVARSRERATGAFAEVSAPLVVSIEDGRLTERTSPNVLILRDSDTSAGSTALLVEDMVAADMTVTSSVLDVTAWTGKRPTLDGFDVALLMGGTASIEGLDPRGQAALEGWVRAGGALVLHEPLGELAAQGQLESMRDLVLLDANGTRRTQLPWQAASGQSTHPLVQAIGFPRSISGEMGGVALRAFAESPAEILATASDGTPTIATREVGSGRVVHLNLFGNASNIDAWADQDARHVVVESLVWALPDVDGDTVPGWRDNCIDTPNTDQTDTDQDGWGDACDPCPSLYERVQSDIDQDGAGDACDLCPGFASNDADGDGICDGFASCGVPAAQNDADQDGIPDTCGARSDNCLGVPNTAQRDSDGDGAGDACDPCPSDAPDDSDGDGVCDAWDRCEAFDDSTDNDGDGIPDGCDETLLDRAHFVAEGIWLSDAARDVTLAEGITSSGVDLLGVGLWHDARLDRLVVRIDVDGIAGDVDGDGDPSSTSTALAIAGGVDLPDFGQEETIVVLLDLDDDGVGDVVMGTPYGTSWDEARVSAFAPGFPVALAPLGFGDNLENHRLVRTPSPSSTIPDVDFVISNASALLGDGNPDDFIGVRVWSSAGRSVPVGPDQIPDAGDFSRARRGDLLRQDRAPSLVRGGTFAWFGNFFGGPPTWDFLPLGVRRDDIISIAPPRAPGQPALTAPVYFEDGVWPSSFKAFPNGEDFDVTSDPVEVYSQLFHSENGALVRETMRARGPEFDTRGTALNNIDMQSFRVVTLACSHRVTAIQHEPMGEVLGPRFIGMTDGDVFSFGHTQAPVIVHHLSFHQFDGLGELEAIHEYCPEDYLNNYEQVVGIAPSFTHYAFVSEHDYAEERAIVELTPLGGVLLEPGTWVLNASYWTWANSFATHLTYSFEPGPDCPIRGAQP